MLEQPVRQVPAWVKDAVFYQIFPDRFAKSARVVKPNNLRPWESRPTAEGYFGGDLYGVLEHLDHIQGLGCTAIYFTPIFASASNHRYHTADYYEVDPLLGGNKALRDLIDECHSRGLKIVLDGVFNHASRAFLPFNDILEHGPNSPYLDWFFIQGWPLSAYDGAKPANYVGWAGNRALPKFNTDNPLVREYLMQVAEFWVREYQIDGWRLDVPEEITTPGFWQEFRTRVRAINPEAYIVGEIWHDSRQWLDGTQFDAVMNYLFTGPTIAFTAGDRVQREMCEGRDYTTFPALDAAEYAAKMDELVALYDWEHTQVQMNLLDSHDTARMLSVADGDQASLRLATLLQMTFPGAPCIFYGDEIGLAGAHDPDCRPGMPWDKGLWDHDLLAYFRGAIRLRQERPALRRGKVRQVAAVGHVYAMARIADETLLVVVNAGEERASVTLPVAEMTTDGTRWKSIFGTNLEATVAGGKLAIELPARSGLVLGVSIG